MSKILEKIIKKRNISYRFVNNHKTKIYHIKTLNNHIVSKDMIRIMSELYPIYQELDSEFQIIDVVDLIYYERWLNE